MARKGGGSTQRMGPPPTINGHNQGQTSGIPPPSTIAAQIVHNAANVHAQHDPAGKVTFGELVKEFLQHPNTDEPDAQLVALVCVIAQAGLEGLFRDDPFDKDQPRQQGVDSIATLKLIIEQKPHLLLSLKDSEGEEGPSPPLLLWLFPKLLGLLTHASLQTVHEHVQGLLSLCLTILAHTSTLWRRCTLVLKLYKSCVQRKLIKSIR